MTVVNNVLESIGHTPLVPLQKVVPRQILIETAPLSKK